MATIIITICAAALVAFGIWRTVQKFRGRGGASCCGSKELVTKKKVDDTDPSHYPYHYRLDINDMVCSNCARNVENTLNGLSGIWARVDLGRREADVLAKQTMQESDFREALRSTSYTLAGFHQVS